MFPLQSQNFLSWLRCTNALGLCANTFFYMTRKHLSFSSSPSLGPTFCFSAVFSTDLTEIAFPLSHGAASHLLQVFPAFELQTNSRKFHTFAAVLINRCRVRKRFRHKSLNFSLYCLTLSKFLFSLLLLFSWSEQWRIRFFIICVNQFGRCPLYRSVLKNKSLGFLQDFCSCVLTEWQNEWNENHKWSLRNVRAERLAGRFSLGWSRSDLMAFTSVQCVYLVLYLVIGWKRAFVFQDNNASVI